MKWYNSQRTACLDIDSIDYWKYDAPNKELLVVVGGLEMTFSGNDAEQIYNILKNRKEVL